MSHLNRDTLNTVPQNIPASQLNIFAYGGLLREASLPGTKTELASKTKSTLRLEPQEAKNSQPTGLGCGTLLPTKEIALIALFLKGEHIKV